MTDRSEEKIAVLEAYLKAQGLFRVYDGSQATPNYSGDIMELDLSSVKPSLAGPKRPHDRVEMDNLKQDFHDCLANNVGFKGFGIAEDKRDAKVNFNFEGEDFELNHGSVVIAAITSCTNTSNSDVMLQAGFIAKNAVAKGLKVKPYIKTSLSPGSGVVTQYLEMAGVTDALNTLGFTVAGYGCMTCIGNSGELPEELSAAITSGDLVVSSVLSGNRNFEGRVHPLTRANFLASPPLCVAYALAGRVDIEWETEPVGQDQDGNNVFLRDIWPSREDMQRATAEHVKAELFREVYSKIAQGTDRWNALNAPEGNMFSWEDNSTYIHNPPFFQSMGKELPELQQIQNAHALCYFGDSITTDHISPAGNIAKTSCAARFLADRGVAQRDFNSYGARRGNDEIMARGTFANVRLVNKLVGAPGPKTMHVPSGETMDIYDAAMRYKNDGVQTIIIGGKEYGSGSSRDWAAKGPYLQGVKAVIAQSFERIHRSNLLGMGILPLQFKAGESGETYELTGSETFNIEIPADIQVGMYTTITASNGKSFQVTMRLDTEPEITYFKNGGILHYVLRKLINA
eukprot:NODE_68_length_2741_cov_26.280089_g64_i0.p1 GENE.NODE_68_length_2741_cov_26.280089_g64_i0~~NODE_68_length_2741_cov_26.280089_g64_i0.p1  ORF type:complete len:571 (-),score=118.06 NODE_68_length_2741_cov_26.280089_g64_i0:19-1731(-)